VDIWCLLSVHPPSLPYYNTSNPSPEQSIFFAALTSKKMVIPKILVGTKMDLENGKDSTNVTLSLSAGKRRRVRGRKTEEENKGVRDHVGVAGQLLLHLHLISSTVVDIDDDNELEEGAVFRRIRGKKEDGGRGRRRVQGRSYARGDGATEKEKNF
jgi:hypothetical protein